MSINDEIKSAEAQANAAVTEAKTFWSVNRKIVVISVVVGIVLAVAAVHFI